MLTGLVVLYVLGTVPTAAALAPWTRHRSAAFRIFCTLAWPILAIAALVLASSRGIDPR